jgi:DNA-binding transcriptional regulator YiaG
MSKRYTPDEITQIRTGLKLTHTEFAKRYGIDTGTRVRKWEEGVKAPIGRNCDRIALAEAELNGEQPATTVRDGELQHALAILRRLGIASISLAT